MEEKKNSVSNKNDERKEDIESIDINKTASDNSPEKINDEKSDNSVVRSLKTALILSFPLTMLVFSITYNMSFGLELSGKQLLISIILACVSLLMWCGASVWGVFLKIKFIPSFSLLVWGICIISYVITYSAKLLSQGDLPFGYIMSIFYSPSYSFYPIASAVASGTVSFFIMMLIFPLAVCISCTVSLIIMNHRDKR